MSRIRRVPTGTVPPAAESGAAKRQRAPGHARLVGLATVLTTAVVLLAALVVGSAVFAAFDGIPGPATGEVVAHVVGGIAGLALRRWVRRVRLPLRVVLVAGIAVDLGLLLWFYWWW